MIIWVPSEKLEPLHLEAKAIFAEVLGEKHPDYAWSLNQQKPSCMIIWVPSEKSEQFYLEAFAIRAEVLVLLPSPHHSLFGILFIPFLESPWAIPLLTSLWCPCCPFHSLFGIPKGSYVIPFIPCLESLLCPCCPFHSLFGILEGPQ